MQDETPTQEQFAEFGRSLWDLIHGREGSYEPGPALSALFARVYFADADDRAAFEAWKRAMGRPMLTPERTGDAE